MLLRFLLFLAFIAAALFTSCETNTDNTPAPQDTTQNPVDTTDSVAIATFTNATMGAQTNANGSWFSASTGQVYSSAQADANVSRIDLTYAVLGSPEVPTILSWNERDNNTGLTRPVPDSARNTYFKSSALTPAQFQSIQWEEDAGFAAISVSTASPQRIEVREGKVYEFRTQNGKKGLFHVANLDPGVAGAITINTKVQR